MPCYDRRGIRLPVDRADRSSGFASAAVRRRSALPAGIKGFFCCVRRMMIFNEKRLFFRFFSIRIE